MVISRRRKGRRDTQGDGRQDERGENGDEQRASDEVDGRVHGEEDNGVSEGVWMRDGRHHDQDGPGAGDDHAGAKLVPRKSKKRSDEDQRGAQPEVQQQEQRSGGAGSAVGRRADESS